MRSDRHKKKKRKLPLIIFLFIMILTLVVGIGYYSRSITQFVSDISVNDNSSIDTEEANLRIEEKRPFSMLLLGMDKDQGLATRTDTIIVATINPDSRDMKLVSIPRDTLVTTNFGFTEKINAMYTYGGIELLITEVEKLLDIPIAHYATLDFEGLAELVDAVGGIQVYSDFAFTESNSLNYDEPIQIKEGLQRVNGAEALGFARMRKQDPRGDFGRQERQQAVIEAIVKEVSGVNILTNLNPVLSSVSPYLKTNLTGEQMMSLALNYSESISSIDTYQLNGADGVEYFPHYGLNVYVFNPSEESLDEVTTHLQEHLNVQSRHSSTQHLQTKDNLE